MFSFNFFRRFFYEIHLWLGILCGIVVFLICLSGSILVFREEINRFVDPGKYYVSVPADGQRMPIDELINKVESKNPGMKVTSLTIPEKKNRTIVVSLSRPMLEGERGGFGREGAGGRERASRGGQSGNREGASERGERGNRTLDGTAGERGERGGRRPRPEGTTSERGGFGNRENAGERGGFGNRENAGERSGVGNRENVGEHGGVGNRENAGERGGAGNRENAGGNGGVMGREGQSGNREGQGGSRGGPDGQGSGPSGLGGGPGGQGGGPGGQGGGPGSQGGGRGGPGGGRGQGWYVNPYTGDIVAKPGDGVALNRFFMSMTQLHRNLWISYRIESLGPRSSLGSLIVGVATLIFVVVMLSGLVLWLPRTWKSFIKWRAWKPGFKIRFRKGFWCFIHDIHNTVGFYFLIPVLILALTGLCWSFTWYRSAASYVLGEQVLNRQRTQRSEKIVPVDENAKPLSIDEMIEHVNKLIPGSGEITLAIPNENDRESPMTIQKGKTGFFALSVKDRMLWDRFRGTVIPIEHYGKTVEIERLTDKPVGTQIASTIRALHFGEITGTSSKIVFFIACVFAMTFPITGIALWGRKLVKRYRKRRTAKKIQQQEQSPPTIDIEHHLNNENQTSVNTGQTV